MANGNIVDYLEQHPDADRWSLVSDLFIPPVSMHHFFLQSHDIVLGLEYLHSFKPQVIHGDLKGVSITPNASLCNGTLNKIQPNILITSSARACLADFGLGTVVRDSRLNLPLKTTTHQQGTMHWFAPEIFEDKPKTTASDMYAFGCVLHEVMQLLLGSMALLIFFSIRSLLGTLDGRTCLNIRSWLLFSLADCHQDHILS